MTRGQAIDVLNVCKDSGFGENFYSVDEFQEALNVAVAALKHSNCPNSCEYCKHSKVPLFKEPCDSCCIKDLNMTDFINNFEPREES